ncbi:MAG TPA: hypothetical protein VE967_07730, partial [Gemmatimonadaceae bacterium]|nr:hypothetical protein [Gemmatimonadaceae bacterium]
MNAPAPVAARATHPLLRPRVFFPLLLGIVLFSVLMSPRPQMSQQSPNLTTHATGPQGASGLMGIARRFGWRASRLEDPVSDTLPADAVYAVLVPDQVLTTSDWHILLDRVRAGASLLALAGNGTLRDSLHVGASDWRGTYSNPFADSVTCPRERPT